MYVLSTIAREEGDEEGVQVSRDVGQLHHQDMLDEALQPTFTPPMMVNSPIDWDCMNLMC